MKRKGLDGVNPSKYTHRPEIKLVSKGWGFEKILKQDGSYCCKYMRIVKGMKTSLGFYKIKDRTIYIHSGKVRIYYTTNAKLLKEHLSSGESAIYSVTNVLESQVISSGDNFHIPPGMIIQIIATDESEIYEFSTKHVEDDYHRLIKGD
jgi:hypothetical protein